LTKSNSDILYKAKNYFLLQVIFFILGKSIIIIFNNIKNKIFNVNENKYYIQKIFEFFDEFQKNSEINSQLNFIILVNYNFIPTFLNKILEKIDIKIIEKYETKFKSKLINLFSHFLKYSYKKPKIYNLFLNSLKQSFINLYDF